MIRLTVCGVIFVLLVAVKLLFPQTVSRLAQTAGELIGRDADFKEAFAAMGRAVSGEEGVGDSLQDAYAAVFSPADEDDAVLASAGEFDALVTGDMSDTVEGRLVKYGRLPDIELLVVGHHGSKYATSEELLRTTAPELAVISVGYNNYGHPTEETLARLAQYGCQIYRTDWYGTVTVTVE